MTRYKNFYKSIGESFNGTSGWYQKREKFLGVYFKESDGGMSARYFYGYSLRDAYQKFSKWVEAIVNAYGKSGQVVEFALFSQKILLLSSADYEDPITQILIGEGIRAGAVEFPE